MTTDKGESRGLFYGATDLINQNSNTVAANAIVKKYVNTMLGDVPDTVATENGNSLIYFNGNTLDLLPNTKTIDVNVGIKGAPANPYMPDLTSPGALSGSLAQVNVNFDKDNDDVNEIVPKEYKPNLNISPETLSDKFSLGTVSPHVSSRIVGVVSLGSNLTKGSSTKT